MKLSEVITHIVDFGNHPEGIPYLLISKYDAPHVYIVSYLLDNNGNYIYTDDGDMIFKSDTVNIEFLSYYLKLNMHLLKKAGNTKRSEYGYELDHLTPEYIGNIEIPEFLSPLRGRDIQDKLIPSIGKLYDNLIELPDSKIQDLFDINHKLMLNHEYPIVKNCNGSDLFKVTNVTLFFKNILKGNLNENPQKYLNNLRPEIVMTKYLVYYLHYSNELFCLNNYNHYEFDINEFHGKCIDFKLPLLNNQLRIIQNITSNHTRIVELKKERKEYKSILRQLINNL